MDSLLTRMSGMIVVVHQEHPGVGVSLFQGAQHIVEGDGYGDLRRCVRFVRELMGQKVGGRPRTNPSRPR